MKSEMGGADPGFGEMGPYSVYVKEWESMEKEHQIIKRVYAAKENSHAAETLIREYIPFVRAEATKFMTRLCTEQDDEHSIAMIAFYEAIMGYRRERGAFLSYAALLIRSRLIDFQRKEARHQGHLSLHEENGGNDERILMDRIPDQRDVFAEAAHREATRQEIRELAQVLESFGLSFSDVADNCPRQERTMEACARAIRQGGQEEGLLETMLRTKKLPMSQLAAVSGVERKTLERHRKYILAMLVIQTNGYEIIRGHLYRVLKKGGNSLCVTS